MGKAGGGMSVEIKVDLGPLNETFRKLDGAVDTAKALMAGGLVIEAYGKEGVIHYDFIDTGATLNSLQAREAGDEVHVGPTTDYAIWGELGARGNPPKPFMADSVEYGKDTAMQAIAAEIERQIRGAL
jgi:hypothetical protein